MTTKDIRQGREKVHTTAGLIGELRAMAGAGNAGTARDMEIIRAAADRLEQMCHLLADYADQAARMDAQSARLDAVLRGDGEKRHSGLIEE